jgi:hypothetical protein
MRDSWREISYEDGATDDCTKLELGFGQRGIDDDTQMLAFPDLGHSLRAMKMPLLKHGPDTPLPLKGSALMGPPFRVGTSNEAAP